MSGAGPKHTNIHEFYGVGRMRRASNFARVVGASELLRLFNEITLL